MRLSLHFLSWRAVAAVEQGVAEGLGWGSAKAGVFFVGIDPLHAGQSGFTGFFFNSFRYRAFERYVQDACTRVRIGKRQD